MRTKKMMMAAVMALFVMVLCGCGIGKTAVPVSVSDKGAEAQAQTEEMLTRLCGWWEGDRDTLRKIGMDRVIFHISEDGTLKNYMEITGGTYYYTEAEVTDVSGSDITMTGSTTGVSNRFYMTENSLGQDVLIAKDMAYDDAGYFQVPFERTDESVIEGKTYIHVTQAGQLY